MKEAIGLNLESDEQVARRLTGTGRTTLTFETDARPGFGAGGNRDEDLTLDSGFPGAMARATRSLTAPSSTISCAETLSSATFTALL